MRENDLSICSEDEKISESKTNEEDNAEKEVDNPSHLTGPSDQ